MVTETRISYLEGKLPKNVDTEKKYRKRFEREARYLGNGVYGWGDNVVSTDTRELFLMGVLIGEGIKFKQT